MIAIIIFDARTGAEKDDQASCERTLPENIEIPRDLERRLAQIYRGSATFRAQCDRIGDATRLSVSVRLDTIIPSSCQAFTIFGKRGHRLYADVHLPPSGILMPELVGHEFEHIVDSSTASTCEPWRTSADPACTNRVSNRVSRCTRVSERNGRGASWPWNPARRERRTESDFRFPEAIMNRVILAACVVCSGALSAQQPAYDLLIRSGHIVDGTGNPWFEGDVAARTMAPPLESALGVPLVVGDSLVGTLTLYSSRLIQIIAPHIAQAILTARRARGNAETPSLPAKTHAELKLVASR